MILSSTCDNITRCTADDSCETNNGFIVYSVDMLAMTIIKFVMYNTAIFQYVAVM